MLHTFGVYVVSYLEAPRTILGFLGEGLALRG